MTAPWERKWDDPIEVALASEGVTGRAADFARSIYQQESGGGRNTRTSNAGAVGGMQIIPDTFKSVADRGWDINDPVHNARAGVRYALQGFKEAGGDPALAGAYYYGGPGGMAKARQGVAVRDPRNPNAPDTLQYGQQVAARLPKERGLVQRVVEAVIPSAEAASSAKPWERQWTVEQTPVAEGTDIPRVEVSGTSADPTEPEAPRVEVRGTSADEPGIAESLGAGLGRGVGRTVLGAQRYVGKAAQGVGLDGVGDWLVRDAEEGRARLDEQNAPYKAANPIANATGNIGGEVFATLPVGGVLARGASAVGLGAVAPALATAGFKSGIQNPLLNMATRVGAGGAVGYTSAALVDENSANTGGAIGAALPVVGRVAGAVGNAVGGALRPFTASGQKRIVGDTLRQFADDPDVARAALAAAQPIVPGSAPTVATAGGDAGLAALQRSMQNANAGFAGELAARQTAQNAARTAELQAVAGNPGKIETAKAARKAVTAPMREQALAAAGQVEVAPLLQRLERMAADPERAGKLSQQGISQFRRQIEDLAQNGTIDARALYEVRKDIGTVMSGRLQGDAGNLRFASGTMDNIQEAIDDAIDLAARRVTTPSAPKAARASTERAVTTPNWSVGSIRPGSQQVATATPSGAVGPVRPGSQQFTDDITDKLPRASWREYLQTYAKESIPINQMDELAEVLRRVQTGSVDQLGNPILSAANLNRILKDQGQDLAEKLNPQQLDVLRRVQADLNAQQIANNVGRAVGSNTFQNAAQNNLLTQALGPRLGRSTPATAMVGRLLQIPYGTANAQIQERLGGALLDPMAAAQLMAPQQNRLLNSLQPAAQLGYRVAPVLGAQ